MGSAENIMAKGDLLVVDWGGKGPLVRKFTVKAGKGAVNAGEPVRICHEAASGVGLYVVPLEDATPTTNGTYFLGVAANTSTQTASADGTVDVYLDQPGVVIYSARPKTAGAANSQAKIDSYQFYRIVIDLTSSNYTADLASDSAQRGFVVIGGEPENDRVHFICANDASWQARAKG